jgi:hypothetical protein
MLHPTIDMRYASSAALRTKLSWMFAASTAAWNMLPRMAHRMLHARSVFRMTNSATPKLEILTLLQELTIDQRLKPHCGGSYTMP